MKDSESAIFKVINVAGSCVMMNIIFILSCIPVITIGAAWCGLYGAIRCQVRGDDWFKGYKEGFKKHFLHVTPVWVVLMALNAYVAANVVAIAYYRVDGFLVPLILSGLMLLVGLAFVAVMLPVRAFIPGTFRSWLQRSAKLLFMIPLRAVAVAIIMLLPVGSLAVVFYDVGIALVLFLAMIAVLFVLAGYLSVLILKAPLTDLLHEAREEDGIEDEEQTETTETTETENDSDEEE